MLVNTLLMNKMRHGIYNEKSISQIGEFQRIFETNQMKDLTEDSFENNKPRNHLACFLLVDFGKIVFYLINYVFFLFYGRYSCGCSLHNNHNCQLLEIRMHHIKRRN